MNINGLFDVNGVYKINSIILIFLLDQAPHLYSLSFYSWSIPEYRALLMKITSVSVRQLALHEYLFDDDNFKFDDKQCIELSRSPLGKQCKTLSIHVKNRQNVLDL